LFSPVLHLYKGYIPVIRRAFSFCLMLWFIMLPRRR
jgi:hypothetical protein